MSRVSLSLCLVAIAGVVDEHALGDGISSIIRQVDAYYVALPRAVSYFVSFGKR
jgi:hypothetical protein